MRQLFQTREGDMALSDLTESAVNKAIEEFDHLGRDTFLKKYGFAKARSYVLHKDGHEYDSKAIAGAAHGYLPGYAALRPNEFSGGEATVRRTLEGLGFTVVEEDPGSFPSHGDVLTNDEIGRRFAVGNMGGMRRSRKRNLLVLISDPFKGLYQDRWEGDVLHYTGMGLTGDQSLSSAQNRTLTESLKTGIPVHLLEALDPLKYTYAGEVELIGAPYQEEQLDNKEHARKVWMFPVKLKSGGVIPILTDEQARAIEQSHARIAHRLSMEELQVRAKMAKKQPSVRTAQASAFVRDAAVAEYVKRLANGLCDLCDKPAPFENKQKEAYLECHHIIWLAQGGEDTIGNTVALCPNCHRKMHVLNQKADKERLAMRAAGRAG
jgi:5-methylcytosine-specific restriction enzyme A